MASQYNNTHAAAPDREPLEDKPAVCHRSDDLIQSIDALHSAILQQTDILKGLGKLLESRYSTFVQATDEMFDEQSMAKQLGITQRVLAQHRKNGKMPGCWIRNGRQILWHTNETLEAWKRGIA